MHFLSGAARSHLVLIASLALGACGSETGEALPETVAPPPAVAAVEARPQAESLYGPDGVLLPSDTLVAGLPLPRGLDVVVEDGRRHVYTTDVPLGRVQRYFGVRLITGAVDARPAGGATYHDALPRDARGSSVHLEVTIEPSSASATRVEIVEIEPAPLTSPPEAETIERARERMERAD